MNRRHDQEKTTMPKHARFLTAVPSVDRPPPRTSPPRHDLAAALLDLRDAERKATTAREPLARLEAEIADEAAARALLDEVDAHYGARMAEWGDTDMGNAPEPDLAAWHEAQAALTAATLKAEAARIALTAARQTIAEADARAGAARARIKPAVAAALRAEGAWLTAEYWRRYADLEQVRRELTALDEVLIADFPTIHAPTGRLIVNWISPVKQSAADALDKAEAACAGMDGVSDFARFWRAKAEELGR
jgi:hypothetical protein